MEDPPDNRHSKVELKISVGIEYTRKRAVIRDQWETRVDAVGLIIIGGAIVLFVVIVLVPRIISLF